MADISSVSLSGADELKSFIKSRLLAFDPTIDVSDGAPVYFEVIDPIIARVGVDPLSLDTKTFITQRIQEAFPDIYTSGAFEDLVINPIIVVIEKLTQEIKSIKFGQSLNNPELLSDEEVDILGSKYFETRRQGNFSTAVVRVYYPTPRSLVITTDTVFRTSSGLRFFPINNQTISSAQMLFNKEGFEYFIDVAVVAEGEGDQYNVDRGEINSVEDLQNPIRVFNTNKASGGLSRESNTDFLIRIENSRGEQSLVTKRGATAKTLNDFTIRGLEIIGAGEEGMDRDILQGTSEGKVVMSFRGGIFGQYLYVDVSLYFFDKGISGTDTIKAGDTVKFRKELGNTPGPVKEAKILSVLFVNANGDKYFCTIDTNFGNAYYGQVISGVVLQPGYITISKAPGGMFAQPVPDNTVHIGGHTDVYVATTDNQIENIDIKNIIDEDSYFKTVGGNTYINDNKFDTANGDNFTSINIEVGDTLIIELGSQAGSYEIVEVSSLDIRVNKLFTATTTNNRARIVKTLRFDYTQPKRIKLPFETTVNDLTTLIGSKLFTLTINDLQSYGVVVGDYIEIISGPNKDIYQITAFDTILGGFGPIVDKPARATEIGITYKVYSLQQGITPPFIRMDSIELLDANNQPTNIFVPYGELVDIRAKCDFEGGDEVRNVQDKKAVFLPDFFPFFPILADPATPGANTDARYTQKLESYDGVLRKVTAQGTNPITTIEINLPPWVYDGKRNTILGLTTEKDSEFLTDPFGNPQTSPIAKARPGYVITINSGPNAGAYYIKDVRKLNLWGKTTDGHYEVGLLEIDGEFPFDPINDLVAIIDNGIFLGSGVTPLTINDYLLMFEYATAWTDANAFIQLILAPRVRQTLIWMGFNITSQEALDLINSVTLTNYSVGPAIKGELRLYTKEPVTTILHPENPFTLFEEAVATNSNLVAKKTRLIPTIDQGQLLPISSITSSVGDLYRTGSQKYPAGPSFFFTQGDSFAKRGVQGGDILEFYPAINDYSSRLKQESSYLAITTAGSNIVQLLLPSTRNNQTALLAGQYLFIDSGPDSSNPFFVITEVISDTYPVFTVRVNRNLTHTTSTTPTFISFTAASIIGGTNEIDSPAFTGNVSVNDWISIYAATSATILSAGDDIAYIGTFKVISIIVGVGITVNRTAVFPANASCLWVKVPAPTQTPDATTGGGTKITTSFVRFRQYSNVKNSRQISINWATTPNPLDPTSTDQIILNSSITTNGSIVNFSHKSPFRILRANNKTIPSTELQTNREKGLYYYDVSVISLGLTSDYIFKKSQSFNIGGNYQIEGYKLLPDNSLLTYSTKETGRIEFPNSFLPVGATFNKSNYIELAGTNLRITYDSCPTIQTIQNFYDSPLDRINVSNHLIRHYLPGYLYLELTYSGGRSTDEIYTYIKDYINNISSLPFKRMGVDDIENIVKKYGATQVTNPIELIVLIYDTNRQIKTVRSFNQILNTDAPIFKGLQKMVLFIPGPDVSKESKLPDSEYIKLSRV